MLFQITTTYSMRDIYYVMGDYVEADEPGHSELWRELPEPPEVRSMADVVPACDWLLERDHDKTVPAGSAELKESYQTRPGTPQAEYLRENFRDLLEMIPGLPDSPACPYDSRSAHTANTPGQWRNLVKKLKQWAARALDSE